MNAQCKIKQQFYIEHQNAKKSRRPRTNMRFLAYGKWRDFFSTDNLLKGMEIAHGKHMDDV